MNPYVIIIRPMKDGPKGVNALVEALVLDKRPQVGVECWVVKATSAQEALRQWCLDRPEGMEERFLIGERKGNVRRFGWRVSKDGLTATCLAANVKTYVETNVRLDLAGKAVKGVTHLPFSDGHIAFIGTKRPTKPVKDSPSVDPTFVWVNDGGKNVLQRSSGCYDHPDFEMPRYVASNVIPPSDIGRPPVEPPKPPNGGGNGQCYYYAFPPSYMLWMEREAKRRAS